MTRIEAEMAALLQKLGSSLKDFCIPTKRLTSSEMEDDQSALEFPATPEPHEEQQEEFYELEKVEEATGLDKEALHHFGAKVTEGGGRSASKKLRGKLDPLPVQQVSHRRVYSLASRGPRHLQQCAETWVTEARKKCTKQLRGKLDPVQQVSHQRVYSLASRGPRHLQQCAET
ncbi:hypothetical protein NDU88_004623 [Pleurodeles waltl]|uniref:Uncharacterized protein n=1 Tax=Pleurodeles waltl TaxID=8319 RepID=A0AAV7T9N6_PLEWA|nr:hypothetical protein NDU88_004623 [Pleurodeles waltl]